MLKEGVFNGFNPSVIIAQHLLPSEKEGNVAFCPGLITAATDEIHITIEGEGGHAALLKEKNAVLAATEFIYKSQDLLKGSKFENETVLAFGRILANGTMNVIPKNVHIDGTIRTLDAEWRLSLIEKIKKLANDIMVKHGCSCEIRIDYGYPSVINDEELTRSEERRVGKEC